MQTHGMREVECLLFWFINPDKLALTTIAILRLNCAVQGDAIISPDELRYTLGSGNFCSVQFAEVD